MQTGGLQYMTAMSKKNCRGAGGVLLVVSVVALLVAAAGLLQFCLWRGRVWYCKPLACRVACRLGDGVEKSDAHPSFSPR